MEPEAYALMNERESTFWWHVGMQKIIDTQLRQYAPRANQAVILDAGCGTGGVFNILAKYGRVYGVDQSFDAVRFARGKNIAGEVLHGLITELPYPDNMFDIVTCLDVLYHARAGDDTQAFQEFHRVLRPGGILIIREPAYNWLRGHQDAVVWTKKRYSSPELKSMIERAGFEIKKLSYVNFFLLPLAVIKRVLENFYKPKNVLGNTFRVNWFLNFIFKQFLFLEARLLSCFNFPAGLSVMCVARKK